MVVRHIPSGRTLAMLGVTSAAFLVSTPLALALDAVVLLLFWFDARRTEKPSARRDAPRISALAAPTDVVVTVTNPAPREVVVKVTDDLDPCLRRVPETDAAAWDRGVRVAIPGQSSVRRIYRVTPRTRGFLDLGAIHMRTLSRWGLAWRRSHVDALDTLQVQPGVRDPLRERSGHAIRRPLRTPGPRRTRQWGEGREFESLRDYMQGDDLRAIDWKASARRRKYLVRNYEAERNQDIVLAIDAGRHMRERLSPDRERMDYALGACMTLASRAQNFGDRIGAVVFDDRIRHLAPPRRTEPAALARVLTGVRTRLVEPNYPLAFATLARTFRKRALVILFCDVIDMEVSSALVGALTRIGRAHLPLAIAIRNPSLQAAATEPVADVAEAFRRAAAEELVQARRATLHVMRRSGIMVVDTPPGDTLVRTLEKYVEIKERGLL